MPCFEDPGRRVELQAHWRRRAGLQRLGFRGGASLCEVQDAAGHEGRRAVGEDVAEPGREVRDRHRGRDRHGQRRVAEDLELRVERAPLVRERERIVLALIRRLPPGETSGARDPRARPHVAADRELVPARGRIGREDLCSRARDRPARLGPPLSAYLREIGLRPRRAAHEHANRRLLVDSVRLVAQPAAEPPAELGHEIDVRPRERRRGRHVAPRPDEQLLRALQGLERPKRVVAVAVGPAGDDHRRARDAPVPRPERPVAPVGAVQLLLEPAQEPRLRTLDPPQPLVAPAVAEHCRNGREDGQRGHVQDVVDEVDGTQRAARVMDVVRVAVVGGVNGADRAERGRPFDGELDGVEAGVRRPVHADPPCAPVLRGEPGDDLGEVGLLPRRVLVLCEALRGPGTAEIHPRDRESPFVAEPLVLGRIGRCQVVHPVRERLEKRRRRLLVGEPEPSREPHAVGERDPGAAMLHRAHPRERSRIGPSPGRRQRRLPSGEPLRWHSRPTRSSPW